MSLFQAREWWSCSPDVSESKEEDEPTFSNHAICVDNLVNQNPPQRKLVEAATKSTSTFIAISGYHRGNFVTLLSENIITGSLKGVVRIYCPTKRDFHVNDLMLECNLQRPILQIECGRFLPNSIDKAVALLHPSKISIYRLLAVGGVGAEAKYFEFELQYEHKLQRTSHSFVYGPFGTVNDKDYLCVQSMDGMLSFFDHESPAFSCYLPNFLIPGPLQYVPKNDSFVTINSQMVVESYTYQMLATAISKKATDPDEEESAGHHSGKEVQVDWSLNVGDHGVSIMVARFSSSLAASQSDIVLVGERTLFTIKPQGSIRLQKRLDFSPSCATCFRSDSADGGGSGERDNLIIGTHQKSLMILRDTQLIWAARTQDVPVAIRVASFGNIRGLIVVMFANGTVQICYLGTDPTASSKSFADSKELNYADMEAEHKVLLRQIRKAQNNTLKEPLDRIRLWAEVPDKLDEASHSYTESISPDAIVDAHGTPLSVTCKLLVIYEGEDVVDKLQICVDCCPGIIPSSKAITIDNIRTNCNCLPYPPSNSIKVAIGPNAESPLVVPAKFFVSQTNIPSSLEVRFVASFVNAVQEPRTERLSLRLPFCFVGKVVNPERSNQFSITIDTNRPPLASMAELFGPEMRLAEEEHSSTTPSSSVVSVKYHTDKSHCTVLMSNKSGRYRLQSASLIGLWPFLSELLIRLKSFWEVAGGEVDPQTIQAQEQTQNGDLKVSFAGPVPFPDYWRLIDEHLEIRLEIQQRQQKLECLSRQLRVIQKRLLARYKEKMPMPLLNFDVLLKETIQSIKTNASEVKARQMKLFQAAANIGIATNLISTLVILYCGLDDDNAALLQSMLSSEVDETSGQGWEERIDASMTYLLRTVLAKNAREASAAAPSQLIMPKNSKKIRKHVKLVCDRLAKGNAIFVKSSVKAKKKTKK